MNWQQILNRFSSSRAGHIDEDALTSVDIAELEAVDRLYSAAPRLEPGAGFRAGVRRRIGGSRRNSETPNLAWFTNFARRPLLAGAMTVVIASTALTLFWATYSQAHAAPVLVCEIKGMICQGCARNVSEILSRVPGVRRAEVDVKTGRARVILQPHTPVSLTQLSAALEQTKYFHISDVSVAAEPEQR
jgi:copper chaperone CopZ